MEGPVSTHWKSRLQEEHTLRHPPCRTRTHRCPPIHVRALPGRGVRAQRPPKAKGAGRLKKRRQVLLTRNGFFQGPKDRRKPWAPPDTSPSPQAHVRETCFHSPRRRMWENRCVSPPNLQGRWRTFLPEGVIKGVSLLPRGTQGRALLHMGTDRGRTGKVTTPC